jgi:hypothetical protein
MLLISEGKASWLCRQPALLPFSPAWMRGWIPLRLPVWWRAMPTLSANAGGRAGDDAIRSPIISYKLLGTREFFGIHHTDCGMEFFSNDVMRGLLASSLETAQLTPTGFCDVGNGPGSRAGEYIEWLRLRTRCKPYCMTLSESAIIRYPNRYSNLRIRL